MFRHLSEKLEKAGKRAEDIGKPHKVQFLGRPDLPGSGGTALGAHHALRGARIAPGGKSFEKSLAIEISRKLSQAQEEGQ